ncbi:glycogen synthase GlgA [Sulfuriferula sp. GW1]|uniref:glycogen synthase GlgA n=1 Tax=Sulfuriferula sp. GW1 TaxID=3345111 RepID=UPI0039B07411
MNILFATSEIYPLAKTGGLADVSGALPAALRKLGLDVRVLIPGYPKVLAALPDKTLLASLELPVHGALRLYGAIMPDSTVPLIVIEHPGYYNRHGGPYQDITGQDWPDNYLRFGLLSAVAALLGSAASPLRWPVDIVHCNDWQTGLAPAYLHHGSTRPAATLMTIHNLAYQGIFPPHTLTELGLPPASFSIDGLEYYGNLSFLKAGLYYADHLSTVSPSYAEEIQHDALGFGMQGLLHHRRAQLTGIVNGIDTDDWNPATDPHLCRHYHPARMSGKAAVKRLLQAEHGLTCSKETPLFGVISRMTHQKGQDLLLAIAPQLIEAGVQIMVLGSGDVLLETRLRQLAAEYPAQVGVVIGYDEGLAHRIEAGADIFLMPSRFEPCGLNQMYSQRYGTPPVVHRTGGLADTVTDTTSMTLADGSATGFMFEEATPAAFLAAVRRALDYYHSPRQWSQVKKNAMARDFSWEASARQYQTLYQSILAG